MTNMKAHIRARSSLALTFAEDGAYHAAATVLRDLASDVEAHAKWLNDAVRAALAKDRDAGGRS